MASAPFLLGVGPMTDRHELASGPTVERILARSTWTRLRGLALGVLVSVAVQPSSAVTVTAIGFANSGLLSLGQALLQIASFTLAPRRAA